MPRNVQGETSFAKIRARSGGCVKEREAIQNERHQQFIAYEMELPISYMRQSSGERYFIKRQGREKENTERGVIMEEDKNHRGGDVPG